jgi:hypothetical protein
MGKTISLNVSELPPAFRDSLEDIMESPLASHEHVIIMTYTPGTPPDKDASIAARDRVDELRAEITAFQQAHGITPAEAEAACDEAIEAVRAARRR